MLRKNKILSLLLCFCLLFEQSGFAQVAGTLDISGHITAFRNQLVQDKFRPLHLRSLGYDNSQNNFRLQLDKGDLKNPKKPDLEVTTKTLLNYFLIGIALPNDCFWVNLRPDSENNIIDPDLATTDVGKILLEADLQLKKDTAKFTSPETPEGREYWEKLYQKAGELLGYENITIPTLTRPWIVPGEIIIRETKDNAYIYKATLKVMLEQDYLKDSATYNFDDPRLKTLNEYSSQLIRDLVIPKLSKEINTSQRYAPLRQVYYSLILAQWFKVRFYGKGGLYSRLIDRRDLQGLTSKISWSKTTYFKAYQKSFKDGEYNIQQPVSTPYGQTVRSYFSGGFVCNVPMPTVPASGIASERIKGPTEVTAISGDEDASSPLTDNVIGVLAVGGNTMDPSEAKVTIIDGSTSLTTGEASLSSGLPAGSSQSGASSVVPTATNIEEIQVTAKQASSANLGAQVSDVKHLDRLLRLLNVLRRSENVPEVPESASDRDIMEFCIKYLQAKRLITTTTDEDGNVIITVNNNALNHPDETVRRFVEAIQRWVIDPEGGVRVVNFQGKDGVWMIVGFELELQDKDTLDHEQQEIKFRKQGLSWLDAHNRVVNATKNPLPARSYEKFRGWLENIPQDKLENTVIFLDTIETLLRGLSDSDRDVCKASIEALKALIDAGLVSKEEVIKKVKEKKVVELLLRGLSDSDLYVCKANIEALKVFIDAGLVSKEEVIKEVKEKKVVELLLRGLSGSDWYVCKANIEALKALIDAGLVSKEEVKEKKVVELLLRGLINYVCKANIEALKVFIDAGLVSKEEVIKEVKEKKMIEFLLRGLSGSDWYVCKANIEALKVFIDAGLASKEEVIKKVKEKKVVELLLRGLSGSNRDVRKATSEALKALIDAGLVSKEEVKEKKMIEFLLRGLSDPDLYVCKANIEALKALIDAGLASKEEVIKKVKEKKMIEFLLRDLSDSDWYVRKATSEALKALIDAGLVSKEEVSRNEIENMFREVYGRELVVFGSFHYYLKFLSILRDDPAAAYQIFSWSREELLELFQILYYFVKAVASDSSYKAEARKGHFLEEDLIKNAPPLLNNPQAFLSHLKQKIKATINDNSVKLAIRVYEVASVNAARGLIKALGLDKGNVVILYDREIDSEEAQKFFPGYNIRAFSGFDNGRVVKIEFHDYGNMKIDTSGGSIAASLPYTPFKFNLPERGSEEELSSMRELLGIGSRRVIVIGSPSDAEFKDFIQSYNSLYGNLPCAQRPLLIIGFRQRRNESELRLLGSLSGQSIAVRSDANATLPNVASNNVLILNTAGELLKMYALADVAIVGNDRNIFEPASQKAAVLYFEGSWLNNKDAKEALVETGAAQIFSRGNLERLINVLDDTRQMAERGLAAVRAYKKEVESKAEEFALQIIGMRSHLRNKFISVSPPAILNAPEALSPSIGTAIDASSSPTVERSIVSDPTKDNTQRNQADKKGGIDFRALPIINQQIKTGMLKLSPADLDRLGNINLDSEWAKIQNMVNSSIIPSSGRIKEYVLASCLRQNLGNQMNKVLGCIANIMRMEEDLVVDADVGLKDMLVLIEAGKPEIELQCGLSQIKISSQEPKLVAP